MSIWGLQTSEEAVAQACQHYWVIDAPNGPTSTGMCQKCGTQKEFCNILETPDLWDQTPVNLAPLTEGLALPAPEDPSASEG